MQKRSEGDWLPPKPWWLDLWAGPDEPGHVGGNIALVLIAVAIVGVMVGIVMMFLGY